jgi:hypothetical protein
MDVSSGTNAVSVLSGELARIQPTLLIAPDLTKGTVAVDVATAIANCMSLASKYIASKHGFYPRPVIDPAPAAMTAQ